MILCAVDAFQVPRLIYFPLQERWDSESMEDADEQRIRLVREFVKGGPQRAVGQVEYHLSSQNPYEK